MATDYSIARLTNCCLCCCCWLCGLFVVFLLLVGLWLMMLATVGFVVLYSAGGQSMELLGRQVIRRGLGFGVLLVLAHIPPYHFQRWTPWLYGFGVVLLLAVAVTGEIGKGAQRWLDLG